ncbi:cupin domain-containing protein [uncultured Aquitalea sp.]|uniref:cupin domain-containing protein n=1 Tax=uncultured Aquitalea sp. TaxID=540272 RepID=UPI0025DEF171|nr:cupin domain-containing protein [uncultured Aquitalea sp.]
MSLRITHFSADVAPTEDRPRPDRLLSGNPRRLAWTHYETADEALSCGVWACETGAWRIRFAEDKHEFFCVLEGEVRLHEEDGATVTVLPGEAAVIPAGFVGVFEVVRAVRKYFVVAQTPQA